MLFIGGKAPLCIQDKSECIFSPNWTCFHNYEKIITTLSLYIAYMLTILLSDGHLAILLIPQ